MYLTSYKPIFNYAYFSKNYAVVENKFSNTFYFSPFKNFSGLEITLALRNV